MRLSITLLGIAAIGLVWGANIVAQDPVDPPVDPPPVTKLFAGTKLAPPEGAANTEAIGSAKLLQWGDRMAIHVGVRHLEPGATYDVVATKEGADPATLGTITTRDDVAPEPTVFKACLRVPATEPEEGGMMDGGKHWHHRTWGPTALAIFKLNADKTEASYDFFVMGGTLGEVSVVFGTGDPVVLNLDEELAGKLTITAEQYAAMKAGTAAITAKITVKDAEGVETVKELKGTLKPLFERFFEFWTQIRAGTGALRLDTERGDKMPFDVTTIKDLVGVVISVKDATAAVVLTGTVGDVFECIRPDGHKSLLDGVTFTGGDQEVLAYEDRATFFTVGERHDASFVRGDSNDDGSCDMSDAIHILQYMYVSGPTPYSMDAADANDSGSVDISDVIGILESLYLSGGPLPSPGGERGFDHSVDELSCAN